METCLAFIDYVKALNKVKRYFLLTIPQKVIPNGLVQIITDILQMIR